MPHSSNVLAREIQVIRKSFSQLSRAFEKIGPYLTPVPAMAVAPKAKRPRRKPRLSPQTRAALKLQGRYMGTMRGLPAVKRAKVKRIRAEKGVRAAIAYAKQVAS